MRPDAVRVIEWPAVEPVSLSEVRQQLGLMADQIDHDRLLLGAVATARRLVEQRLGTTLVATKRRAKWLAAPAVLHLPSPPVLVSEDYPLEITVDGVAVDPEDYEVDTDAFPATVEFDQQPSGVVVAEYWAGVAPGDPIDPMIRSAILAYVTHQFENRGVLAADSALELPQAFETLLAASSWNGGW